MDRRLGDGAWRTALIRCSSALGTLLVTARVGAPLETSFPLRPGLVWGLLCMSRNLMDPVKFRRIFKITLAGVLVGLAATALPNMSRAQQQDLGGTAASTAAGGAKVGERYCLYNFPTCCGIKIPVSDGKVCDTGRGPGINCTQYLEQYPQDRLRICEVVQKKTQGKICPELAKACQGTEEDACKDCNESANKLKDQWKDFKQRWDAHIAELEAQRIYKNTRKYREDKKRQELWDEGQKLRQDWEKTRDSCFQSAGKCKIGQITDEKTSAPPKGSRSAPSTMPSSEPSAPSTMPSSEPSATPEPSGKPPPDKYESCKLFNDPKYGEDDEYIEWWGIYCLKPR